MPHDFDDEIALKNSHLVKWDRLDLCGVEADDGLAMWVADMDFRAPAPVRAALQAEIDRGVLGYYGSDETLRNAICAWMETQHDWTMQPDWITFSHGVVAGLGITLEALTQPGDGIIIFTPVYHAFSRKIVAKGRRVVESLLAMEDGQYVMDFDALEAQLDGTERMVIHCSPHNPGGKLWTAEETRALADFCKKHDLILISDEIHMDLVFPGHKHITTAVAAPECLDRLILLTAASKGFNIAGAETSFIVTPDPDLRARIASAQAAIGGTPNRFGMIMMEAALTDCADWSSDVCAYLGENFRIFRDGVNAIPGLHVMDMDSTYLAWVDFAGTGMERPEFSRRVAEDARIAVNAGPAFGTGGESYLRFNLATRRALVEEAVTRLAAAFSDLQ